MTNAQIVILMEDHQEWIFETDSDENEPEQMWKDLDTAIEELKQKNWEVVQGPAPIYPLIRRGFSSEPRAGC
jgi:hypothetical protein